MTNRKRLRKIYRFLIPAAILLVCIGLIFIITRPKQESDPVTENTDINNNEESGSEAQLIETEGDIEIIIPDDQESDGF